MKHKGILTLFLFSFLFVLSFTAQGATIELSPIADGDVQTWGGDSVDSTDTFLTVTQSGGLQRQAILEFDLSAVDDAATIISATLEFTLIGGISNIASYPTAAIDIFAFNGDGIVDIGDYSTPGTQVVDTTTPKGGAGGDVRGFGFTELSPIQLALVGNMLTLRIETDSFATINFAALENSIYDQASLTINYSVAAVPIPPAFLLMASGLALFGGIRRRVVA